VVYRHQTRGTATRSSPDALVAREVAPERLSVARLLLVVELLADRARELVDELPGVDEVELAHSVAHDARDRGHQLQIGFDLARRRRPLHLDHDVLDVREGRPMHLADRGGGDRPRVEREERAVDPEPELLLDDALDVLDRERRHVVLELLQLDDDVRRDDVGPGREQLTELHERRAELVEHLPQASAPVAVRLPVGRAPPVDEVAEPVSRRDPADLGDP
jgi:hypothetical protein